MRQGKAQLQKPALSVHAHNQNEPKKIMKFSDHVGTADTSRPTSQFLWTAIATVACVGLFVVHWGSFTETTPMPLPTHPNTMALIWITPPSLSSKSEKAYTCGVLRDDKRQDLPLAMQQFLKHRRDSTSGDAPVNFDRYLHYTDSGSGAASPKFLTAAIKQCQMQASMIILVGESSGAVLAQDYISSADSSNVMALVNVDAELQTKYRWMSKGAFKQQMPILSIFTRKAAWRAPGVVATSFFHDVLVPRQFDQQMDRVVDMAPSFLINATNEYHPRRWSRWVLVNAVNSVTNEDKWLNDNIYSFLDRIRFDRQPTLGSRQERQRVLQHLVSGARDTMAFTRNLLDALLMDSSFALQPHCGMINDEDPLSVSKVFPCFMGSQWVQWVARNQLMSGENGLADRQVQLQIKDEFHAVWIHFPLHFPEFDKQCPDPEPACRLVATTVSNAIISDVPPTQPLFKDSPDKSDRTWVSAFEHRVKIRSRQAAHKAAGYYKPSYEELDGNPRYCAEMNQRAVDYSNYLTVSRDRQQEDWVREIDVEIEQQWWQHYGIVRGGLKISQLKDNWVDKSRMAWIRYLTDQVAEDHARDIIATRRSTRPQTPLNFTADDNLINGGRWVFEAISPKYIRNSTSGRIDRVDVQSQAEKFDTEFFLGAVAGIHYCKLVSVGAAVEWAYATVRD